MTRCRLRDLGITIGNLPTGQYNAITDVSGVQVGHSTLNYDHPRVARTGVTVILPSLDDIWQHNLYAGYYCLNGDGEMSGLLWVEEAGLLSSPIALTNTHQVGLVRDALVEYALHIVKVEDTPLPVVAETFDGWLSDAQAFHLTKEQVYQAIKNAAGGPVAEGNVGGGTGSVCHEFKGGIGTASRIVEGRFGQHCVGALVQTNQGDRKLLQINGAPVGQKLGLQQIPAPWNEPKYSSSIIAIIATDAPLIPVQCKALAQRATIGLARTGGIGHTGSGDIFLAFSTANTINADAETVLNVTTIPQHGLNALFEATIEAVEEAIINSLTAAETTVGFKGRTAHALPLDDLQRVMANY